MEKAVTKKGNNLLKQQARKLARIENIPYSAALARLSAPEVCEPCKATDEALPRPDFMGLGYFQKTMAQAMLPSLQLQKTMAQAMLPSLQLQKTMAQAMLPSLQLQKTMAQAMLPSLQLQKTMAQIFRSFG
jgi:hypothetical protein